MILFCSIGSDSSSGFHYVHRDYVRYVVEVDFNDVYFLDDYREEVLIVHQPSTRQANQSLIKQLISFYSASS